MVHTLMFKYICVSLLLGGVPRNEGE